MSNLLIINSKEYVPAVIAGKHFGYTKDYILLLIKQGHIDGQKVGNKWYVNIPSAEKYFTQAQKNREVRRKQISDERKRELQKIHTQKTSALSEKKSLPKTSRGRIHAHTAEVLVVSVIALSLCTAGLVGTTSQVATVHGATYDFFENIAESIYNLFVFETPETISSQSVQISNREESDLTMEETAVSAHIATTTYTSFVVAPEEVFTATTVEAIQDSFSDPVEVSVDSENPNTGIITPIFKEGKGEQYRFLMVPVEKNTE